MGLNPNLLSDMHEDILMAHRDEGQLAEVRVRSKILKGMKLDQPELSTSGPIEMIETYRLPEEPICFVFVFFASLRTVLSADMDASLKRSTHKRFRGIPGTVLCV